MANFGKRLKAAFEASGLSQAELARRTGVSQASISMFLSGTRDGLDYATFEKLCEALGLDLTVKKRHKQPA